MGVDRISKRENETGCYTRPTLTQEVDAPKADKAGDMVDALLANEAQRKREQELKQQQEDAAAQKRKELKCMSLDDLKKRLAKKALQADGNKKEDMVEALFIAGVQEDAANARKSELKSKSLQELKELLARNGLESGGKEQMIKTLLEHEAKCRKELQAFEAKVAEVAAQKKEELATKTNAALKELCAAKGLPVGGDKDDRIERIVDEAQKDGDLDKVVCANIRNKRKLELMSMDKPAVVKLCETAGVDPAVKDVMVERIMSQESEGGAAIVMTDVEPASKRARSSKK